MNQVKGLVVGHDGRSVYVQGNNCGETDCFVFPHLHDNPGNLVRAYKGREVTMKEEGNGLWTINL